MGQAGPSGKAGDHRSRDRFSRSVAKQREPRRTDWERTGPQGTAVHLFRAGERPADISGRVRKHRCSRITQWGDSPREGRCPRRVGRAELQHGEPLGWKGGSHYCGLPTAWLERRANRKWPKKADG